MCGGIPPAGQIFGLLNNLDALCIQLQPHSLPGLNIWILRDITQTHHCGLEPHCPPPLCPPFPWLATGGGVWFYMI